MTLQERLNTLKSSFEKSAPKEALKIMHRATTDLNNSGIMDGVVKVGEIAPDFELQNNDKTVVRLKDFLSNGPLVLTFYRGKW